MRLNPRSIIKVKTNVDGGIYRPKYARDKSIKTGMKIYAIGNRLEARWRAPKNYSGIIGVVLNSAENESKIGLK